MLPATDPKLLKLLVTPIGQWLLTIKREGVVHIVEQPTTVQGLGA
jgi:hypothetical protein